MESNRMIYEEYETSLDMEVMYNFVQYGFFCCCWTSACKLILLCNPQCTIRHVVISIHANLTHLPVGDQTWVKHRLTSGLPPPLFIK